MTAIAHQLTGDYVLDTARTRIGFVGRHTMAGRVRGHFEEFEGRAYLDGDDPSRSRVEVRIQAGSLRTRNRRRDRHLRRWFLDTAGHPVITFTSTEVGRMGETGFRMTGDLTMRGVTEPVTVDLELTAAGHDRVGFAGGVPINRMHWGVNWNAATGVLVSPEVLLEFEVSAVRRP